MRSTPQIVKGKLKSVIRDMADSPELFVRNPGRDFTRRRKFGFARVVSLILGMGRGSLPTETLEARDMSPWKLRLRWLVVGAILPVLCWALLWLFKVW